MRSQDETLRDLRRLDLRHRPDGDGGYSLLRAIDEHRAGLDDPDRSTLDRVLLQLVSRQDRDLWGVALEALVRSDGPSVGNDLERLLLEGSLDSDGVDYVVQALLRIGHRQGVDYARFVREALANRRAMAVPNLAALARVLPDVSIELAADYLISELRAGRQHHVESNIPPFLHHLTDVNDDLIRQLVDALDVRDREAADLFRGMLRTYLALPFVESSLGAERVARIASALSPP